MLQYLLNTTMIWLLSLLVFNMLLGRESYHGYNRLYLLLTFLLGIFLPLLQWQDSVAIHGRSATLPVAAVIDTKQAVVQAATIETANTIDWIPWVWIVYYTGMTISFLLFVKDAILLGRYFTFGTRSKDGVWHIVETGKQHGPFSIARYIFISSRKDYEPAELQMVLAHEQQHGYALHFIDMLIMEAGKIVFWFHPLVYLFRKKLLMLHEYQADAAAAGEPNVYGRFLLRQSMLQNAPSLSHSFNRSPIKKRIVMLTRTSSFKAGFKRLVAIPLCIICMFLFTKNAVSKNGLQPGEKIYYKGNVFELKQRKLVPGYVANSLQYKLWTLTTDVPDTIVALNPRTAEYEKIVPVLDTFIAKMNGRDIFWVTDLSATERDDYNRTTGTELNDYLMQELQPLIGKLGDGYHPLYDFIILDDEGKIVYMEQYLGGGSPAENAVLKAIEHATKKFSPVKRAGNKEIMRLPGQSLLIKGHEATIVENGC